MSTFETLRDRHPRDASVQSDLAAAIGSLALVQYETRRMADAETNFRRALAIESVLTRDHPADPDRDVAYANTLDNYAQLAHTRPSGRGSDGIEAALAVRSARIHQSGGWERVATRPYSSQVRRPSAA